MSRRKHGPAGLGCRTLATATHGSRALIATFPCLPEQLLGAAAKDGAFMVKGMLPKPCPAAIAAANAPGAFEDRGALWGVRTRSYSKGSDYSRVSEYTDLSAEVGRQCPLAVPPAAPVPLKKMPALRVWDAVAAPAVLKQRYQMKELLGSGAYGTVVVGKCMKTGQKRAVKKIPVAKATVEEPEVRIAGKLHHPHIVFLYETFSDHEFVYLVMDLCTGGDLANKVARWPHDPDEHLRRRGLPMKLVARYMWEMLSGIAYMHHHGIVHRDIKLENYLLASRSDDAVLKLIDFGFACELVPGTPLTRKVGTPGYLAPEVLTRSYDEKCDIWGMGVCSFFTITGRLPHTGRGEREALTLDSTAGVMIKPKEWVDVPPQAQMLIKDMLARDPEERPGAADVLATRSSWLRAVGWDPNDPMDGVTRECPPKGCCTIS